MQQISSKSTRSASRPVIWLTLAFHLALGAYLYVRTSDKTEHSPNSAVKTEQAKP